MHILSYFFATKQLLPAFCLGVSLPLVAAEPLFTSGEWRTAVTSSSPLLLSGDSSKEASLSDKTGLKLNFTFADLRCYFSRTEPQLDCQEKRYGAGIFLARKTRPVTIKAGKLTFGNSLAQLTSPAPAATVNPLSSSFTTKTGLNATLPTLTSTDQGLALALSAALSPKNPPAAIEGAIKEDGNMFASLRGSVQLSPYATFHWACTGGRFFLESSSTLKSAGLGFTSGWFQAGLMEGAFYCPLLHLAVKAATHQSPYEGKAAWIFSKMRSSWQNLLLDASLFYIPTLNEQPAAAPVIGSSSTVCRVRRQWTVQPQLQLISGKNLSIRAGAQLLYQERVTATKYADIYSSCKAGAGLIMESPGFAAKIIASSVNFRTRGAFHTASAIPEAYYGLTASVSLTKPDVKATVTGDIKHYPREEKKASAAEKDVCTARLSVSPGRARKCTVKASWTSTWKEGALSQGEADCSLSVKGKRGQLLVIFTGSLSLPLK